MTVDYVVLDKTSLADAIELEEGAVQAQYEIERSSFEGSAEKRAGIVARTSASFNTASDQCT